MGLNTHLDGSSHPYKDFEEIENIVVSQIYQFRVFCFATTCMEKVLILCNMTMKKEITCMIFNKHELS